MPAASFDALIIGTGQAGPALAARLAGAGMKVDVEGVEHAFPFGCSGARNDGAFIVDNRRARLHREGSLPIPLR
jgi:2-polyprenyl-6-methoxyphenol hydroxylase-like FAD-dependent oxidoreductase